MIHLGNQQMVGMSMAAVNHTRRLARQACQLMIFAKKVLPVPGLPMRRKSRSSNCQESAGLEIPPRGS